MTNRQWTLTDAPIERMPTLANFALRETPVPVPGPGQGVFERADNQPTNHARITEPDLGFARMDVDVNITGRKFEKQRQQRMTVARQKILIGPAHRTLQQPVLDRAAIDKHELHLRIAAVQGRHPGIAGQANTFAFGFDLKGVILKFAAHDCPQPFQAGIEQITFAGRVIQNLLVPVPRQGKANIGPGHRQPIHDFARIHLFRPRGFKKLQACRCRIEKVSYLNPRAKRVGGGFRCAFGTTFDRQRPGIFRPAHPAGQAHPRYRSNGWQGFAAKPHEADIEQIIIGQLGCRVAFNRKAKFIGRHTLAIVSHRQQGPPAVAQGHVYPRRPGIQGIFHQFLQRRGRAFNHLTGGNLVDQVLGQDAQGHEGKCSLYGVILL